MINIVVACDLNNAIGNKNQLLCNIKDDMKHFKELTLGEIVVMGRKTFESIGHPLPNRQNIILSKTMPVFVEGNAFATNNIDLILQMNQVYPSKQIYIIGGQQIYELFLPHASRIYLTRINHKFEQADAFLPEIDIVNEWNVLEEKYFEQNERNEHSSYISTLMRK